MRLSIKTFNHLLLLCLLVNTRIIAQTTEDVQINTNGNSKFKMGLYLGVLMPNQNTAFLYNGYGFDNDGTPYNFSDSWINQKINLQYGGGYPGQQDQIAEQLNVIPYTWTFNEGDMPTNMRYNPAFNIGLNTKYSVDKHNAIIMHVNAAKLAIGGNFTIFAPGSQQASTTQINTNIQTFSILGSEQRLILNFGYQHIFGEDDAKFAFFVEGGLAATLSKFDKNFIIINNLTIDLMAYNNFIYNNALPVKKPVGIGFGAFSGIGIDIKTNSKYSAQLVYNPSLETIKIHPNATVKLQNTMGVRFYYNF